MYSGLVAPTSISRVKRPRSRKWLSITTPSTKARPLLMLTAPLRSASAAEPL